MRRRFTGTLILLYALPWGLQCIVNTFMSVYVASLPFSTDQTVGNVMAFGAAVTMLSQLVWSRIAYRSKNRFKILTLSLILLVLFSTPFLFLEMNLPLLYASIFLFYFCFMVHQPLIDSIATENTGKLVLSFGAVRSFSTFGYALAGLVLGIIGYKSSKDIFYYIAVLAGISAIISATAPKEQLSEQSKKERFNFAGLFNKRFVCFLIYTFMLYMISSVNVVFFPVYYSDVLHGELKYLSIMSSIEAFLEWGIMIVFGAKIAKTAPRKIFLIIVFAAAFRCLAVWFTDNPHLILLTYFGSVVWFGFQWTSVAPYICRTVPTGINMTAQSIWAMVSSGLGATAGSLFGGIVARLSSIRSLFLLATLLTLLLAALTPVLIPRANQKELPAADTEA